MKQMYAVEKCLNKSQATHHSCWFQLNTNKSLWLHTPLMFGYLFAPLSKVNRMKSEYGCQARVCVNKCHKMRRAKYKTWNQCFCLIDWMPINPHPTKWHSPMETRLWSNDPTLHYPQWKMKWWRLKEKMCLLSESIVLRQKYNKLNWKWKQ